MRLRQIALAASDLGATVEMLTDVLGIEVAFRDPGVAVFGLENAVMPIGETFLEVVSPVRADATAQRWISKRGGDAGYMAIFQCSDLAALASEVERAKSGGAAVVWEGEHAGARTAHFHPRELGAIVSFDGMPSWEEWVWAGPAWREHVDTKTVSTIAGAELAGPDPESLAQRWSRLLGLAPHRARDGRPEIALPRGGRLVFAPGSTGDALVGVEIALVDRARFEARARAHGVLRADGAAAIAGVRFVPTA
jgi:catechol 2,3-dioxygenase-like lactoylglutathione lyase family enzyme